MLTVVIKQETLHVEFTFSRFKRKQKPSPFLAGTSIWEDEAQGLALQTKTFTKEDTTWYFSICAVSLQSLIPTPHLMTFSSSLRETLALPRIHRCHRHGIKKGEHIHGYNPSWGKRISQVLLELQRKLGQSTRIVLKMCKKRSRVSARWYSACLAWGRPWA